MIKLRRSRTKEAIPGGLRGRFLVDKNLSLLRLMGQKGELGKADFKSAWWKPAKDQLKAETHGKCAYCEADTAVVAHGDVEHFRPKSRYWWLAYCVDNYLYACQICNQVYKGDRFPCLGAPLAPPQVPADADLAALKPLAAALTPDPLAGESNGTLAAFHELVATEQALLIDPYSVDPETLLVWEADEDLKEVRVFADPGLPNAAKVTQAIEDCFGLNREELRRLRWRPYEVLLHMKSVLQASADPDVLTPARGVVALYTAPDAPFAGMSRFFARVWGLV